MDSIIKRWEKDVETVETVETVASTSSHKFLI